MLRVFHSYLQTQMQIVLAVLENIQLLAIFTFCLLVHLQACQCKDMTTATDYQMERRGFPGHLLTQQTKKEQSCHSPKQL